MAEAAPAAPAAAPAKKKGGKMGLIVACVVSLGAGAATPMFVNVSALMGQSKAKDAHDDHDSAHAEDKPTATVPFGEVVVNLQEDRMTRYLRIKMVLLVDAEHEKTATEKITKKKEVLINWLNSYLVGKTLKDVSGSVAYNSIQREIFERFEDMLYPEGHSPLRKVLFEAYVIQ